MNFRPGLGLAAVAAFVCCAAPALAAAPVHDLHSALLVKRDLPAGLGNKGYAKFYAHFAPTLSVRGGSGAAMNCSAPPYLFAGWKQGMIEDWPGTRRPTELTECSFLVATVSIASSAFLGYKTGDTAAKSATEGPVHVPTIGNESFAIWNHPTSLTTFYLVFRHANAIITLTYSGPKSIKLNELVKVARAVNSRLR